MPYGLFDYGGTINTLGASPPICSDGATPTLTTYKDPALGNRDIGFGKGINGSFKCPPPNYFNTEVLCKNGTWDMTSGFVKPCLTKGGEAIPRKVRPYTPPPPPCAPTLKTGNCLYKLA